MIKCLIISENPLSIIPVVDAYMKVYCSSFSLVCYFIRFLCLFSVGGTGMRHAVTASDSEDLVVCSRAVSAV